MTNGEFPCVFYVKLLNTTPHDAHCHPTRSEREPAAAPYDAERAVPPRLPAQPRVACLLRAAVVLLGTVVLTRGALRLLRALAPLLPRLGFALE